MFIIFYIYSLEQQESMKAVYLAETILPFGGLENLEVVNEECPLQVSQSMVPHLLPGITAQPCYSWAHTKIWNFHWMCLH